MLHFIATVGGVLAFVVFAIVAIALIFCALILGNPNSFR